MNKKFILVSFVMMLLLVGLTGCLDQQTDEGNGNNIDTQMVPGNLVGYEISRLVKGDEANHTTMVMHGGSGLDRAIIAVYNMSSEDTIEINLVDYVDEETARTNITDLVSAMGAGPFTVENKSINDDTIYRVYTNQSAMSLFWSNEDVGYWVKYPRDATLSEDELVQEINSVLE